MTYTLTITLADAAGLAWAQATVTAAHYLHAPVGWRIEYVCELWYNQNTTSNRRSQRCW